MNGEDTSSSSSEEEEKEKEGQAETRVNGLSLKPSWSSAPHSKVPPSVDGKEDEDDDDDEEGDCLPTIFFSHTVEPKKVRLMNDSEHFFLQICFLISVLIIFFPSPSFAAGENKHWKKHHAEVQRKERTEGTLEEEKEKRTLASRTPQNHNAGRHLQVKNKH